MAMFLDVTTRVRARSSLGAEVAEREGVDDTTRAGVAAILKGSVTYDVEGHER